MFVDLQSSEVSRETNTQEKQNSRYYKRNIQCILENIDSEIYIEVSKTCPFNGKSKVSKKISVGKCCIKFKTFKKRCRQKSNEKYLRRESLEIIPELPEDL